jgi:hypothetical protein
VEASDEVKMMPPFPTATNLFCPQATEVRALVVPEFRIVQIDCAKVFRDIPMINKAVLVTKFKNNGFISTHKAESL